MCQNLKIESEIFRRSSNQYLLFEQFQRDLNQTIVLYILVASRFPREIQLEIEKMKEIDKWIEQFRKIWETRFNQLDKVLSTLKKQKK